MPDLRTAANPNNRLVPIEHARAKAEAVPSIEISWSLGRVAGPCATRTRRPTYASVTPSAPPRMPRVRLSTSNSRAILPQPAPSAARTANSCCRDCARTSTRFATFCANEQQHQPERSHKNAQYRAHVSHHILLERAQVGCDMERLERLGRPLRFRPDLPNARQILIRQRNRNPRPEPCDTGIAVLFRNSALGKALRQNDVWREVNQSKVPWHHSDHLVWNEIDHHRAAQHPAMSAELPLPICVAKDHRLRGPRGVVFA